MEISKGLQASAREPPRTGCTREDVNARAGAESPNNPQVTHAQPRPVRSHPSRSRPPIARFVAGRPAQSAADGPCSSISEDAVGARSLKTRGRRAEGGSAASGTTDWGEAPRSAVRVNGLASTWARCAT
jgi:hypothetical protein